jgi:DNA-directed RNA polymerase specialized sigma24 family protein
MDQRTDAQTRFWIPCRDSLGNPIDHRLRDAAPRISERARLIVVRYLSDDSEFGEIIEAIVDSASRTMNNGQPIQFPEAYLLKCVAREAIHRFRRNQRITYVDPVDLERIAGAFSLDIDRELDDAHRLELLRACMDEHGRKMYDLRILGFSWRYIAKLLGYADGHSAEVQFRKKVNRALTRLRSHSRCRQKSTPLSTERNRSESDETA